MLVIIVNIINVTDMHLQRIKYYILVRYILSQKIKNQVYLNWPFENTFLWHTLRIITLHFRNLKARLSRDQHISFYIRINFDREYSLPKQRAQHQENVALLFFSSAQYENRLFFKPQHLQHRFSFVSSLMTKTHKHTCVHPSCCTRENAFQH